MSLAFGRDLFAIPGPSVIPDRVLAAMHRGAPNIYEGPLIDMTHSVLADLKKVARTDGDAVIYIANGHGAWEAAIANTLAPGDTALVIATGRFGKGWAEMAEAMGVTVQMLDFGHCGPADPAQIAAALKNDTDKRIKAVLVVHTDTASSALNDMPAIRRAMDETGHPALLMADCIASLGCDRFEMDDWGVDITVTGCQKGLMTPPGLGILFVNEKAKSVRNRMRAVSSYWDWNPRVSPNLYYQLFCGTAPTHHLFGLRTALDILIHEEGMEGVWTRHRRLAGAVWAAIDAWEAEGEIRANVRERDHRSVAVTALHTGAGDAGRLRAWCEKEAGLTLGIGLGLEAASSQPGESHFRIGHMGHLNPPMLLGALGTIDTGLKALGITHGPGAIDAATRSLAKEA